MTYTVKDLIEELKCHPEDAEVHFNLEADLTEGNNRIKYTVENGRIESFNIEAQLEITFCSDWSGDCEIDLGVVK